MKNSLDLLLIHTNASNKIYQDLSKDFAAIEQPIWAAMIASYLRRHGFNIEILDCEAERLNIDQSFERAKSFNAKNICVVVYGQQPSASTQNMVGATLLMNRLKKLGLPRLYVGAHPSAMPIRTIQDDPDVFVVKGEGPITLRMFLELKYVEFVDEQNLKAILGLCFRSLQDDSIVINPPAPLITDLDNELPDMALDLLPMEKYRTPNWHSWTNPVQFGLNHPFASLYTSLGCPFQCTFCMINAPFNDGDNKNNRFRHWSPEHIIKTLDKFADMGITNVKIADELFVYKPAHFMKICELVQKRGHKFNFWAYARVDTARESYLEALKKAGVNWLGLGIESGDAKVRLEVTKGKFQEVNIKQVVQKIVDSGIHATGNYIFGLPTDTYESMQKTLDLAMELNTAYANFYCAMAYPGSQLHRDFEAKNPGALPEFAGNPGWIGYSQHSYETFNLPTDSLKNWEVLGFREKAFEKYFTNTEYINKMVGKFGESFRQEIDKMLKIKLKRMLLEKHCL
jgi:radical SAM superfamily enzyme YgiQ (UPF0313 family)